MLDEIGIEIKASLELDQKASQARIKEQIAQIEQALKDTTIKVGLDATQAAKGAKTVNTQIAAIGNEAQSTTAKTQTLFGKIGSSFKGMSSWLTRGSALFAGFRVIKDVINNVVELNKVFVDLKMATGASDAEVNGLITSYSRLGQQMGATTTEVANAANEWLRQGKSIAETNTLIQDSLILSKVAGIESSAATEYLTTAMKGYGVAVDDVIGIVDKLTSVDIKSATTAAGLAESMSKVANNANMAGISMDKLLGYLAVVTETTGASDSSVGNAFSTIFSRMGNIKLSRLKDYGSGEDLSNVETVLRGLGINLRDSSSQFRNFGSVLDEVAVNWSKYSSVSQRAIASAFAGKNQMEEFLVLMQNYGKATEYAAVAADSAGSASKRMIAYNDSVEAAQKRAQASWEAFSNAFLSSDLVKFTYDSSTGILGFLTEIVKTTGAIPALAASAAGALSLKNKGFIQKLDTGAYAPFWASGKANALNQVDVDVTGLQAYLQATQGGTDQTVAFGAALSKASKDAQQLASAGGLTSTKIAEFRIAQEAAIKSTGKFSGTLTSLKAGLKGVGSAMVNMGVAFAASFAIEKGIQLLDEWIITSQEAIDKANELTDAWDEASNTLASNKKTLDSIGDEWATLSKGVSQFGDNLSLTSDQFDRYHELSNQIASMFPELVSGWDDEGNAILKVKGSVEELTSAYNAAIEAQNKTILREANDVFSGRSTEASGQAKYLWEGTGKYTQQKAARNLLTMLDFGDVDFLRKYAGASSENWNAVMDVMEGAGYDIDRKSGSVGSVWDYLNTDDSKLRSYIDVLRTQISGLLSDITGIGNAYTALNSTYASMPDSTKKAMDAVVDSLDVDLISQFGSADEYENWIQENVINAMSGLDFSGILDAQNIFNSDEMSIGKYRKIFEDFQKNLADLAPEVQTSLADLFTPEGTDLLANLKSKLNDEFDNLADSLTLQDLKLAADIDLETGTWDELTASLAKAKAEQTQTIDALTSSLTALKAEYQALDDAVQEQGENGSVTYESYEKLISANKSYADSFEMVGGQLRLNADAAYALADANAKAAEEEAKAAQAAKKADYDEKAKQLEAINDEMKILQKLGGSTERYDVLVDEKGALESQIDLLDDEIQRFQAAQSEIDGMTASYTRFKRAQETPNADKGFNEGLERKDVLEEARKNHKLNTDEVKESLDYFTGEGGESQAELEARLKKSQKIYDRYFNEENPIQGLKNFRSDLTSNKKMGDLSQFIHGNKDGSMTIDEGVTAAQIAEQLGTSEKAVYDLLKDWEIYNADTKWDWESLFPNGTKELEESDSPLNTAGKELEDDGKNFATVAEKVAEIIRKAWQTIKDALAGKETETPEIPSGSTETPETPESSSSSTPSKPNVTQTVSVIPSIINPISGAALVMGATQNVDGTLAISAQVSPGAKEQLANSKLVVNMQDDGTLDVTVNPTPGTPVGKDSIVADLNPEDGSMSVTVNGQAAMKKLLMGEFLLNYDPQNGGWTATVTPDGQTIDKSSLVTGDDPKVTVKADTDKALKDVAALQEEAEKPATKVVSVVYPETSHDGYEPEPTPSPSGATSKASADPTPAPASSAPISTDETIQVSADVDPAQLNEQIQQAGSQVDGVMITANAYNEDSKKKANELRAYIQNLNPDLKVTIKYSLPSIPGNAKGTKNAKPGLSVVDEEGAEAIIRANGGTEIGTNQGPRLVNLERGDQVLTAPETKEMFERGKNTLNLPRFAGGSYAGALPSTGGSSSSNTSSSKKNTKKVNWQKYLKKLFDWVEVRLERLQAITDEWLREIDRAIGYIAKNKAVDEALKSNQTTIENALAGISAYEEQLAQVQKKVKLKPEVIEAIQNGSIDIASYGSKMQEKIKAYQEWWEKIQDLKEQIEDLRDEQDELNHQKLDNIISQYESLASIQDQLSSNAQSAIDLKVSTGKEVTAADYTSSIAAQNEKLRLLLEERTVLQNEFTSQVSAGTLVSGSDAYMEYVNQLNALDESVNSAKTDLAELNKEIENIAVTNLQYQADALSAAQDAMQGTIDLDIAKGNKTLESSYKTLIDLGNQQISNLEAQNAEYRKQQSGLDKNSELYQEIQGYINDNTQAINDVRLSQQEWNDALNQLPIDKLGYMLTALENAQTKIEKLNELAIAQGKATDNESYYSSLLSNSAAQIENLEKTNAELKAQQIGLDETSEKYQGIQSQIAENEQSILDLKISQQEWNDALSNIPVDKLKDVMTGYQTIQENLQQTLDLIAAQGGKATSSLYQQMISNGYQQIENLEAQNEALREQQASLDANSDKYKEIEEQINENLSSINDMKVSQEEWNDAIIDLEISKYQIILDELQKTNEQYQRQLDLQEKIEALEKAKSQRNRRVLVNGQWQYQADQDTIKDAQKALDQAQHDEAVNVIQDAMDALEDSKALNNIYETVGELDKTIQDLIDNGEFTRMLGNLAYVPEMTDYMKNLANIPAGNTTSNSVSNTFTPNSIVIHAEGADAEEVCSTMIERLQDFMIRENFGN